MSNTLRSEQELRRTGDLMLFGFVLAIIMFVLGGFMGLQYASTSGNWDITLQARVVAIDKGAQLYGEAIQVGDVIEVTVRDHQIERLLEGEEVCQGYLDIEHYAYALVAGSSQQALSACGTGWVRLLLVSE
jgi:hypothetical protein